MTGQQLYDKWVQHVADGWPSSTGYFSIFGNDQPTQPRAWAFLTAIERAAWDKLGEEVAPARTVDVDLIVTDELRERYNRFRRCALVSFGVPTGRVPAYESFARTVRYHGITIHADDRVHPALAGALRCARCGATTAPEGCGYTEANEPDCILHEPLATRVGAAATRYAERVFEGDVPRRDR